MSCCDICDELDSIKAEQAWGREALTLLLQHAGLQVPGAPPASGNYWNPADKATEITLSNSDKTAEGAVSGTVVRSITAHSTGKYYAEILIGGNGNICAGLATGSYNLEGANYLLLGTGGLGWDTADTGVSEEGVSIGFMDSAATTDQVVGIAVDFATNKVWFAEDNVFVGDPAAGTDGFTFGIAAPLYLATCPYDGSATLRTASGDFSYTPPTGFTAWG